MSRGAEHDAAPRLAAGLTRAEALALMTMQLRAAGLPTPEIDARELLCGVSGIDKRTLIADASAPVGDAALGLGEALARRLRCEPVSRILGWKEFYGRRFHLSPDVLDPRPETETVVDLVLEIVDRESGRQAPLHIADIGVGSGAILLTLLAELPNATGTATDVSQAALAVAADNAQRLGVASRASFVHTCGLAGVHGEADIVVSNPPYIETADIPGLDRDVRDYDPHLALDGGADGLEVFKKIANDISRLRSCRWAVMELGAGQLASVCNIFDSALSVSGPARPIVKSDLEGHARAVAFEIHAERNAVISVGLRCIPR